MTKTKRVLKVFSCERILLPLEVRQSLENSSDIERWSVLDFFPTSGRTPAS